jgi:hypothetical protein
MWNIFSFIIIILIIWRRCGTCVKRTADCTRSSARMALFSTTASRRATGGTTSAPANLLYRRWPLYHTYTHVYCMDDERIIEPQITHTFISSHRRGSTTWSLLLMCPTIKITNLWMIASMHMGHHHNQWERRRWILTADDDDDHLVYVHTLWWLCIKL